MISRHIMLITIVMSIMSCVDKRSTDLAIVDGHSIDMDLFIPRYVSFLSNTHQEDNLMNRHAFLNSLVDERLILSHAKRQRLHEDPIISFEKEKIYKQLLLNEYHHNKVTKKITVSDKELRRLFKHSKTRLHLRHLYAPNLVGIRGIEKRIRSGVQWEIIAQECFQDSILKERGGDIGWHEMGDLDPAFEITAFELNDGEISSPIKTGTGYSIIQVLERERDLLITEKDYQLNKDWLRNMAFRYKKMPQLRKFTENVIETLEIKFDDKGLEHLLTELNDKDEIGSTNIQTNVLSCKNAKWSIEECISEIARLSDRQFQKIRSTENLKSVLSGILAREKMIEEAEDLSLHMSKDFQNTLLQENVSLILRNIIDKKDQNSHDMNWQNEYFKIRDGMAENSEISIDSTKLRSFPMVVGKTS